LCERFGTGERRRSERQRAGRRTGFQEITPVGHWWWGKGKNDFRLDFMYDSTSMMFRC
jgi:hypothetical protein